MCHRVKGRLDSTGALFYGRGVLGFFPAQLKRPLPGGGNQLTDLFTKGVFSGTPPTPDQLASRFRGMQEPIAAGLSPAARFLTLDSMARSYIAANCSGCHGHRGEESGATGEIRANFDFYQLKSETAFELKTARDFRLRDTATFDTTETQLGPSGGTYYRMLVRDWGMNTNPGQIWDMTLPVEGPTPPTLLVQAGHPALSLILFRQWSRNSAWNDSGAVARALKFQILIGSDAEKAATKAKQAWMFKRPWGSKAWLDTLKQHGWSMDSVIALVDSNGEPFFGKDGAQMPPLATFMPDTAALKILGEWVRNYVPVNAGIKPGTRFDGSGGPTVRGRVLYLPRGWTGPVLMADVRGRVFTLKAAGEQAFTLPPVGTGVYFFRQKGRSFKVSLL